MRTPILAAILAALLIFAGPDRPGTRAVAGKKSTKAARMADYVPALASGDIRVWHNKGSETGLEILVGVNRWDFNYVESVGGPFFKG